MTRLCKAPTEGKLLDGLGGLSRARKAQHSLAFHDEQARRMMADMGWYGAQVAAEKGGTNSSAQAVLAMLEECGRRLAPEPLVPIMASAMILAGCREQAAAELSAEVMAGKVFCVPIVPELGHESAIVGQHSDSMLSGSSAPVFDAHGADCFLIALNINHRLAIYLAPRTAPGVSFSAKNTVDGGTLGRVQFDRVDLASLTLLSSGSEAKLLVDQARDQMLLGYAAQLLGLAQQAFAVTLDYLKTRRQFGAPIGSFQALQHRAATLHIGISAARSFLYEAGAAIGGPQAALAAAAVKAQVSEMAMHVVKEGVQMHGAIGYTDEHDMSLFFRRAMCLAAAGGDTAACLKRVSALRQAGA